MGWTRQNVGVTVLLVMDEHRKQAGQRLSQLRDAKGWSQEDLSRETGLSVKTISRFENGRHDGRRDTVRRIVAALEIDEVDLIGPPPDPLGLNQPSQLDRIEEMLVELLLRIGAMPNRQVLDTIITDSRDEQALIKDDLGPASDAPTNPDGSDTRDEADAKKGSGPVRRGGRQAGGRRPSQ